MIVSNCRNCELADLFVEAWNLCSSVIVNCCDIINSEVLRILDVENSRIRVDIKHVIQHGSFCLKMLQAMRIKS